LGIAAMMAGSLSVGDIVEAQGGNGIFNWFIFQNPLAAGLLFIALLAEVNRAPFDLPEAEQELVAGHMTEYSGMKFAMFFMAEYISMIGISVIFASAYLGGYHFLFVDQIPVLGPVWLILKVVGLLAFMVWIRSALPRIRYDRLMTLGWKVMIPLAMLAFAWSAVLLVIQEETTNNLYYLIPTAVLGTMTIIGISWFALKGQPDTVARPANEVEVVPVGGHGIGFIILQLVGSLISVPFLLHQYTIETVQNARNALSSEKPK
jgi:hypothetical protein